MGKKGTDLDRLFYSNGGDGLYNKLLNGLVANMGAPANVNGGDCTTGANRLDTNDEMQGGMDIAPFITSLVLLGIRLANDDKFKKITSQAQKKNNKKYLNGGLTQQSELLQNNSYNKANEANYQFLDNEEKLYSNNENNLDNGAMMGGVKKLSKKKSTYGGETHNPLTDAQIMNDLLNPIISRGRKNK